MKSNLTSLNISVLVDCKWNEYVLGHCSTTCGAGVLTKTRTKVDAQFGGLPCEGESSIEEPCPIVICPRNNMTLIFVLNISRQRIDRRKLYFS